MRQINVLLQVDHLRQLGDDFTTQQRAVQKLKPQPGTELLRQLAPAIPAVHELVARALVRLSVLDGSQYTATPGAHASLDALSSLVATASNAATTLAAAVAANPLDAAAFPGGPPAEAGAARQIRHDEATPMIAQSLADAALQLEVCATTCHYTATSITQDLAQHPEHRPPLPRLTTAQYTTLNKIAHDGAHRYESRSTGPRITAKDGTTINARPFGILEQHRLVRIDTRTPLYAGQNITVTAIGKLALAVQKPARTQPTLPAAAPARTDKGGRQR